MAVAPERVDSIPYAGGKSMLARWQSRVQSRESVYSVGGPPAPWAPHWFGYFSFEAGAFVDSFSLAKSDDLGWWARYPVTWVGQAGAPHIWVVADDEPAARRAVAAVERGEPVAYGPCDGERSVRAEVDRATYVRAVRDTLARIAAGDLYQANLAVPFRAPLGPDFDAAALFARAMSERPMPFSAYLHLGGAEVVSLSPECLLRWDAAGQLASFPIKGTTTPDAPVGRLRADAKERAEHVMIVDLVRNDLSRVAAVGGVRVVELAQDHDFGEIRHLVSEIACRARLGTGLSSWLAAAFPGGSITGAPKVASTQQIARVERVPRGVYCGALGLVERSGAGALNIPIRTATVRRGELEFFAGGGIVADSDPSREWAEVELKAAGWSKLLRRPPP